MPKGKPKGGRKLAVRVTYERSRLSADCLIQAYERPVPVAGTPYGQNIQMHRGITVFYDGH
jgi:hypothetical protein